MNRPEQLFRIDKVAAATAEADSGSAATQTTRINAASRYVLVQDSAGSGMIAGDEFPRTIDDAEAVDQLSQQLSQLRTEWDQYQQERDRVAEAKRVEPTWDFGGRVHLDNWNFLNEDPGINFLETGNFSDPPEDRWVFRRIRLELAGRVPENLFWRLQIDFNNPNEPEYKDVYLGFDNLPHNQAFLIGNQKRPIGLDHLNSSRYNVFAERPLAVEAFNEDARRIGAMMYGYTDDRLYNWRYGIFLLENTSDDGRYIGNFEQGGLYGRLASSPWYDETSGGRGYYHVAVSGSANTVDGDADPAQDSNTNAARFRTRPLARSSSRWWNTGRIAGANRYQQLGLESMLNIGSVQITSEYLGNWLQRDPLDGFSGEDVFFHGGYVYVNYLVTGEHIPYDREEGIIGRVRPFENFFVVERCRGGTAHGWGALSLSLRYDYLDLTDSDIQGGRGWGLTAGVNWIWTAYSKLQTNFVWGSIEDAGEAQQPSPSFQGVGGDFSILGMRYMIDF